MAAPGDDIQKELDQLDKRIIGLKVTYDQYFLGMEKFEPMKERADIHKLILDLQGRFIRNTGAKFRRDSLKSKFLSYVRYWDRILKQIEDGTYRGHQVKAKLHEKERLEREKRGGAGAAASSDENTGTMESPAPMAAAPRAAAPGGAPADPVQRILDQYVAAKRKTNETVDGLSRDKMAAIISSQTAALKQKYNCKSVEFRVVVEDGKAKLKAVPKT